MWMTGRLMNTFLAAQVSRSFVVVQPAPIVTFHAAKGCAHCRLSLRERTRLFAAAEDAFFRGSERRHFIRAANRNFVPSPANNSRRVPGPAKSALRSGGQRPRN